MDVCPASLDLIFHVWHDNNNRAKAEGMQIQNVSFVNARTKVINCRVMNIAVDLTINQVTVAYI